MRLHAIVPAKSLALAKSRLSEMLEPYERRALALAMLNDVLGTLQAAPAIARVGVISADATVLAVARARGVDALFDHAEDLNGALTQAAGHYSAAGATGLLVMHGDLPLASADELTLLARTLDQGSDLVLAGARDGGTNALACLAPHPLPFLFGGRSLERHLMAARERGLRTQVVRSGGLERDIDRPEDLIWLFEAPGATAAQQLVRRMGIIERLACV